MDDNRLWCKKQKQQIREKNMKKVETVHDKKSENVHNFKVGPSYYT